MKNLKHYNGSKVVQFYSEILDDHGPILAFNLLNPDGSYVGYTQVAKLAETEQLGHVCGDEIDLVEGNPTGAVRISFGFANTSNDVKLWINFLNTYFVQKIQICQLPVPPLTDIIKIEVGKLIIYPIKSCPGIEMSNWRISSTGLLYDRHFMLTDLQGKAITLKKYPKLGQLNLKLEDNTLTVSAKNVPPLILSMNDFEQDQSSTMSLMESIVCKFKVRAHADNEQANKWFSDYLGLTCKLLRNGTNNTKSFANTSQFLLINESSLARVVSDIGEHVTHVNHKSFRPNICIKNQPEFAEESWVGKYLEYQGVLFRVDDHCERCQMICIDDNGDRHKEPLCTLAKRPRKKGKIIFGVHLSLISSKSKHIEM
ncbi:hypothetical protein HK103_000124 [Boothiomyces macroporosus]|uniref:MOSC domain-containing protein n=1 Tax=Boothiomyces macroporosus TaxID=261099 RepID=A0AAD5UN07_9FUNG|nr:hypothetical protein HK103_000124 [Boothiomyces macroporosus]